MGLLVSPRCPFPSGPTGWVVRCDDEGLGWRVGEGAGCVKTKEKGIKPPRGAISIARGNSRQGAHRKSVSAHNTTRGRGALRDER